MLRISFRSLLGDSPTTMVATFLRFSDDGTIRGPDNYVLAKSRDSGWEIGGRVCRDFVGDGPLRLRLLMRSGGEAQLLGPFRQVHTHCGLLYGDDSCLHVRIPHPASPSEGLCHQIVLLSEGLIHAKA